MILAVVMTCAQAGPGSVADAGPVNNATSGASRTLEQRLASLARPEKHQLAYEETRTSDLLSRPVTYRGRLEFDPVTGVLTKWVDEPRQARLAVTRTELEMQAGSGPTRRLPLGRRPDLAALLGGIRAMLEGDVSALRELFVADYLEGEEELWVLQLRPRSESLAEDLSLLEIRGQGAQLLSMDSVMADGQRQRLRIVLAETGSAPRAHVD